MIPHHPQPNRYNLNKLQVATTLSALVVAAESLSPSQTLQTHTPLTPMITRIPTNNNNNLPNNNNINLHQNIQNKKHPPATTRFAPAIPATPTPPKLQTLPMQKPPIFPPNLPQATQPQTSPSDPPKPLSSSKPSQTTQSLSTPPHVPSFLPQAPQLPAASPVAPIF